MPPRHVRIEAQAGTHGKLLKFYDENGVELTSVRSLRYYASVDDAPTAFLEFVLPEVKVEAGVRGFSFECPCGHVCKWQRDVPSNGEFERALDGEAMVVEPFLRAGEQAVPGDHPPNTLCADSVECAWCNPEPQCETEEGE